MQPYKSYNKMIILTKMFTRLNIGIGYAHFNVFLYKSQPQSHIETHLFIQQWFIQLITS